jgi:hypothetical protein
MRAAAFLEASTHRALAPVSLTAVKAMLRAGRKHTEPADVRKLARVRDILGGRKLGERALDTLLPAVQVGPWLDIQAVLAPVGLVERLRDTRVARVQLVPVEQRALVGRVAQRDIPVELRRLMRRRAVADIPRPAAVDVQRAAAGVDMLPRAADMPRRQPMRRHPVAVTKVSNL